METQVEPHDSRYPQAPGWQATLDLGFAPRRGRAALIARRHSGALLVQRPFYPERGVCHADVLHPPGAASQVEMN